MKEKLVATKKVNMPENPLENSSESVPVWKTEEKTAVLDWEQQKGERNLNYAKAKEFVHNGKVAKENDNQAEVDRINQQIVNDPQMQELAKEHGYDLATGEKTSPNQNESQQKIDDKAEQLETLDFVVPTDAESQNVWFFRNELGSWSWKLKLIKNPNDFPDYKEMRDTPASLDARRAQIIDAINKGPYANKDQAIAAVNQATDLLHQFVAREKEKYAQKNEEYRIAREKEAELEQATRAQRLRQEQQTRIATRLSTPDAPGSIPPDRSNEIPMGRLDRAAKNMEKNILVGAAIMGLNEAKRKLEKAKGELDELQPKNVFTGLLKRFTENGYGDKVRLKKEEIARLEAEVQSAEMNTRQKSDDAREYTERLEQDSQQRIAAEMGMKRTA